MLRVVDQPEGQIAFTSLRFQSGVIRTENSWDGNHRKLLFSWFCIFVLRLIFMSTQICSGNEEDTDDKNAPFRQRPFCKYKGHTADLLDLSWSKVRTYMNCVLILCNYNKHFIYMSLV